MRVLVVVGSAGVDPWLSIEESGQKKTWASEQLLPEGVEVVWVEGDPIIANHPYARFLNFCMGLMHTTFWWPLIRINPRRFRLLRMIEWCINVVFYRPAGGFQLPSIEAIALQELRADSFANSQKSPMVSRLPLKMAKKALGRWTKLGNKRVRIHFPNNYFLTPARSLLVLDYALKNHEFDYLVRTVSTSYLNLQEMKTQLIDLPRSELYAGPILELAKTKFVGGALQVLSRDVVEAVVASFDRLRTDVYDDVALARLIGDGGIAHPSEIRETALRFSDEPFGEGNWAFRCKTERVTSQSTTVIERMHWLHSIVRS
jgi:hypothetical protein